MWSIFGVKLNYIVILEKLWNNSTLLMELFMICGHIYRTIVLSYMKLHNAWLLKKVTIGLDNTAKAVDHVKIESI